MISKNSIRHTGTFFSGIAHCGPLGTIAITSADASATFIFLPKKYLRDNQEFKSGA